VHAKFAIGDDLEDLLDPHFAGVVEFQCTAWSVTAIHDREDNAFEDRFVLRVKRAVDEHRRGSIGVIGHRPLRMWPARGDDLGDSFSGFGHRKGVWRVYRIQDHGAAFLFHFLFLCFSHRSSRF
jgi:hypothetical protein